MTCFPVCAALGELELKLLVSTGSSEPVWEWERVAVHVPELAVGLQLKVRDRVSDRVSRAVTVWVAVKLWLLLSVWLMERLWLTSNVRLAVKEVVEDWRLPVEALSDQRRTMMQVEESKMRAAIPPAPPPPLAVSTAIDRGGAH